MFGFFKKLTPFPLKDEQVIEQALKAVTEYAKNHKGASFDPDACVKLARKEIKPVWGNARFQGVFHCRVFDRFRGRWPSEVRELEELTMRITPELDRRAKELAYEFLKKQKVDAINLTTYEALIASELRARGYKFLFQWQKNKVRVTIKVSETLACTQEIKYSDIRRGQLPELIADVAEAVDLLCGKDLNVSIWKMSKDWSTSTKWIE